MPSYNHLKHEYRRIKFVIENKIYNSPISEMIRQRQSVKNDRNERIFTIEQLEITKGDQFSLKQRKEFFFFTKRKILITRKRSNQQPYLFCPSTKQIIIINQFN